MEKNQFFDQDVLFFFEGRTLELAIFLRFQKMMDSLFPQARVSVQKTQISYYGKHLFAAASLPIRRKASWPKECLMITLGLGYRIGSPRIAAAAEPYPGRWTHHVLIDSEAQLDDELASWLREAWDFGESKGGRTRAK